MHITEFAVIVREYDEAIRFYVDKLGFDLIEDSPHQNGKRWVRVRPAGASGPAILLSRAATPEQITRVGTQTGGRVVAFFETDDLMRDYETMKSRGVVFTEGPRSGSYGKAAVFIDLYGNRFDLIEPPD